MGEVKLEVKFEMSIGLITIPEEGATENEMKTIKCEKGQFRQLVFQSFIYFFRKMMPDHEKREMRENYVPKRRRRNSSE